MDFVQDFSLLRCFGPVYTMPINSNSVVHELGGVIRYSSRSAGIAKSSASHTGAVDPMCAGGESIVNDWH
jgi:hypothetical protein